VLLFFFFQAEDGIRDRNVTGVQTCALPILNGALPFMSQADQLNLTSFTEGLVASVLLLGAAFGAVAGGVLADKLGRRTYIFILRSEERRVGKECRFGWCRGEKKEERDKTCR